jgi:TupA-like ATPgrasp
MRQRAAARTIPAQLFKLIGKAVFKTFRVLMPRNTTGDKICAHVEFVFNYRRWPARDNLFTNVNFRMKARGELADPLRVFVSDKELSKLFIKAIAGEGFAVPTLAVLRSMEEVRAYEFPDNCCIKPTHANGKVIYRCHSAPVDLDEIESWFRLNYYLKHREANYRTLRPKVIVEPVIFGKPGPLDYKVFCFEGAPKFIIVDFDRQADHKRRLFDVNWMPLPFSLSYPASVKTMKAPKTLGTMVDLAAKLSQSFSFVRIDFYTEGEAIFVGEITNLNAAANGRILPSSEEEHASRLIFGDLVDRKDCLIYG